MKLLSFSILFGSLLISFNYVWINRIEVIKYDDLHYILLNKWTGKQCYFSGYQEERKDYNEQYVLDTNVIDFCKVIDSVKTDNKVIFP